ncbi:MAG: efflux RND transporter permease subunit, partial [Deltaproteobacteria bacterium]|nr:efflux RND transporter permease subunit [Deltaproteobacteria bacterium]
MLKHLLEFSLRRRLVAVTLFFLVIGAGLYSVRHLTIDAFPDISPNLVQVFAEVNGLAAQEGEELVTRPVEIIMRGLPGVVKVRSLSSFGLVTINIFFDEKIDIYRARQLVTEKLGAAAAMLPPGLVPHGLELGALASGMGKVLGYYLSSRELALTELRDLQEWVVKRELQTVPGVAKIISQGGHLRQFQINLDANRLAAYNLSFAEVAAAVSRENRNFGAGILAQGAEELIIRGLGRLENLDDIRKLPVAWRDRVPIRLAELGEVETGTAFRRGVALRDGDGEDVSATVHKSYGANSFMVVKALKQRLDALASRLPDSVELKIFYDQGALVSGSIATVRNALYSGLLLVSLVSLVFLRRRRAVLVVIGALPFACLFSLSLLYLFKIPGDLLSFGGIAIAMGMIVDATIIMVERLQSAEESKHQRDLPYFRAAAEVAAPIFFAGLIIIIVFIPIFTLGGVEGKMFRPLALTVSLTIAASLFYALVLAPAFCSLLPVNCPQNQDRLPAWQSAYQQLL